MSTKIKVSACLVLVASLVAGSANGWFRKKRFERLGVNPPAKIKVEPSRSVDPYYKVRGNEAIALRGAKSGVRFPWTRMKDENKFYTMGMLWTSAKELYFSYFLDEKVVLHGAVELAVRDSIIDLLEDIDEGLTYMGAKETLHNEIKELANRIRQEPADVKNLNPEIEARFDSVGNDMLEFVLHEYGNSYLDFVDFGSWIYYLRIYGRVLLNLQEAGENALAKELSEVVVVLLKHAPSYEGLCTAFSLSGAIKKNTKDLSDIAQVVIIEKKDILEYAGRIQSAAENVEYGFLGS